MSTKLGWLREKRKKAITFVAKKLGDKLAERVVDLLWVLLVGAIPLTGIIVFLKDSLWSPAIKFLTTPIISAKSELTLLTLLCSFILILLLILWGYIFRDYKLKKNPYKFFIHKGLTFRYNQITGHLSEGIYCKRHHTKINKKSYQERIPGAKPYTLYLCPICGIDRTQKLKPDFVGETWCEAEELAKSKANGELRS